MKDTAEINNILKQMKEQTPTNKGSYGEQAVFKICEKLYQTGGGVLYHSYEYPVDPAREGNIKRSGTKLYIENLGTVTEIDVLLVTPYRVFPIEVKAYKAKKIVLTDDSIDGCSVTDKSPVHQNEMHCRHLYSFLFKSLPDGATEYIIPIVVFVDKCELIDRRSTWQKQYIKATILDRLETVINSCNIPGAYRLDLKSIEQTLKDNCVSSRIVMPCRIL
mgnify:FL=1